MLEPIVLARIGKRFVRPQPAQNFDEFDGSLVALLALQHGAAEHAEFLVEPAVDDIERHAAAADAIERDRKLGDHDRIPQAGMHGDQRANLIEPRADRARQHPGADVVAQVPLGEKAKLEAGAIRRKQKLDAEIELSVQAPVRQRRQSLADGLGDFRRTDGCHRYRGVEAKLHGDDLACVCASV